MISVACWLLAGNDIAVDIQNLDSSDQVAENLDRTTFDIGGARSLDFDDNSQAVGGQVDRVVRALPSKRFEEPSREIAFVANARLRWRFDLAERR